MYELMTPQGKISCTNGRRAEISRRMAELREEEIAIYKKMNVLLGEEQALLQESIKLHHQLVGRECTVNERSKEGTVGSSIGLLQGENSKNVH